MSKKLYLMRHGQTLFNEKKKIQGASDSPLTQLGIEQAR
ncbi:phosphoglycerate mutase, partial [Mammaliicoccus sciuri]